MVFVSLRMKLQTKRYEGIFCVVPTSTLSLEWTCSNPSTPFPLEDVFVPSQVLSSQATATTMKPFGL
jgi:hypothetical protein